MVYALHVERLERIVLANRQVAATFIAAGAKDVELPSFEDALAEFDASLTVEPDGPRGDMELRRALGVA